MLVLATGPCSDVLDRVQLLPIPFDLRFGNLNLFSPNCPSAACALNRREIGSLRLSNTDVALVLHCRWKEIGPDLIDAARWDYCQNSSASLSQFTRAS